MLHKNIFSNYISQAYVTLTGILILPLYIKYMGAEAYGLIGFFTLLQAWFGLLDLGLSPTIAREATRYRSGGLSALSFRQLYRVLSLFFFTIAFLGCLILFLLADSIVNKWLSFDILSKGDVLIALQVMAFCVALRWLGGLYRGLITGAELIVWLSSFNIVIATLRFVGVLISMWFFGYTITVFFIHQLLVAVLELLVLFLKARVTLPKITVFSSPIGWSFRPILPVLKFSMTIAFTSAIWVLATQTDKLILSGILPLDEYGYYTLAVLVASSIILTSGPVSTALMPRMVALWVEKKNGELINIYRNATQLVSVISCAVALTFTFTARPLLFAWTGDADIAEKAASILQLYAIGNGFLVLAAFPYYLQYAMGDLRYHFIGNVIILILLIPSIIYAANIYGGMGAAWVWLILNMFMFFFWVWYVHKKLFVGLHFTWLVKDVFAIVGPTFFVCLAVSFVSFELNTRLESLAYSLVFAAICLVVSALSSSMVRNSINLRVKHVK